MKSMLRSYWAQRIACALLFILISFPRFVSASIPVASLLAPDGNLRPQPFYLSGSIDLRGYDVILDPRRGPLMKPLAPGWNALGTGLNGKVYAIALSGSDVYVGGLFTDAGGNPNADYIARWDGTSWNALGTGLNEPVRSIAVSGSAVYVGGGFTDAGGNPNADGIARWDGTTWNALGTGLGNVLTIIVHGSDVYAGGSFTDAGNNPNGSSIARWDGAQWHALGNGLNGSVYAIAVSGSTVYVGGGFTDAGGNPNADGIARWDGTTWNALGMGLNTNVLTVAVDGSDVYVGGEFTDAGGNPNADYIARWDGTSWNALGTGLNGRVHAILVSGSSVYVGGEFYNGGDNPNADFIARWDGTSWNALGIGLNTSVFSIAFSIGNIYAGGEFSDAGGNSNADAIARYEDASLPIVLREFRAQAFGPEVQLSWQTFSEVNAACFEIQRSSDAHEYHTLTRVPAAGTTSTPRRYSFVDAPLQPGTYYYRLRQVDRDGQSETFRPVSVLVDGAAQVLVYPNPSAGRTIQLRTHGLRVESALLYDGMGRTLAVRLSGNKVIASTSLPSGTYLLELGTDQGRRQIKVVLD